MKNIQHEKHDFILDAQSRYNLEWGEKEGHRRKRLINKQSTRNECWQVTQRG
jgi:hypothetical protein